MASAWIKSLDLCWQNWQKMWYPATQTADEIIFGCKPSDLLLYMCPIAPELSQARNGCVTDPWLDHG